MNTKTKPALLLSMLLIAPACGGDEGDAPDAGGGGGPADASGSPTDAAADDPDGQTGTADATPVSCPSGDGGAAAEVESNFWNGDLVICGTAELPEDATAGRAMRILLHRVDGTPGNEQLVAGSTNDSNLVHYRIHVEAGEYKVGLQTDDSGDGVIGAGDLQGFSDGTVEEPILEADNAAVIDLTDSRNDVHFGLGRL